jgi:hypothetical protein
MDVLGFEERGIHRQYEAWIPAFAGMTTRFSVARSLYVTCVYFFNPTRLAFHAATRSLMYRS